MCVYVCANVCVRMCVCVWWDQVATEPALLALEALCQGPDLLDVAADLGEAWARTELVKDAPLEPPPCTA